MQSNVYVTIGLDRTGAVVEVHVNGRPIEARQGKPGPSKDGEEAPGCEQIVKALRHELLLCRKKGGDPKPPTDPCCYRDPVTGRIWCWC